MKINLTSFICHVILSQSNIVYLSLQIMNSSYQGLFIVSVMVLCLTFTTVKIFVRIFILAFMYAMRIFRLTRHLVYLDIVVFFYVTYLQLLVNVTYRMKTKSMKSHRQ